MGDSEGERTVASRPADEVARWREMRAQLAAMRPPAWEG
jgi:hypothetical protein